MRELNQFQRYLVHEFVDDYNDGVMSRRDMMARVLKITGSAAAAATTLTALGVKAADAGAPERLLLQDASEPQSPLSVPEDDPSIVGTDIEFEGDDATIRAYEARPAEGDAGSLAGTPEPLATPITGNGGLPLVLVCHENRGLQEHIRDVARRFAKEGYVAVAVDLLSREGGVEENASDDIPALLSEADPARHVGDFQAAIAYYADDDTVDSERIGMVGFCFGGGITWRTATQTPELKAAVPFYGPPPPTEDVADITAAVLGIYAEDPEDFANEGRDELEEALTDAGITFEINVYPGTEHAFHNDTGPRYNEEQALAAWRDTLAWLDEYV